MPAQPSGLGFPQPGDSRAEGPIQNAACGPFAGLIRAFSPGCPSRQSTQAVGLGWHGMDRWPVRNPAPQELLTSPGIAAEWRNFQILSLFPCRNASAWIDWQCPLRRTRTLEPSQQAVGIDRNDAAKPTQGPGRRWRMSRPLLRGRLKANAVALLRLLSSPSTRKDTVTSFLP
jgi:hypothetical protein